MKKFAHKIRALSLAFALLAAISDISAATLTFDGGTAGNARTWSASANWDTNTAPAVGDDLVIGGTALNGGTTTLYSGSTYMALSANSTAYTATIRSVTFDNSLGQFLNGVLDLRNSSLATAVAGTVVFNTSDVNAISVLSGDVTVNSRSTTAQMTVNLGYTGLANFAVAAGSTLTFDGSNITTPLITGTGGINKTGPGTLALVDGTNDFAGGLTISEGLVSIDSTTRLGNISAVNTNAIVLANGTLRLTAGSVYLNNINRGTRVGNQTSVIEVTSAAGGLRMQGSIRDITDQNGVLTKTGLGNLSFEGPTHSYTGGTVVKSGTLTVNGNVIGGATSVAGLTVESGATLRGGGTFNGVSSFDTGSIINIATYSANVQTAAAGVLAFNQGLVLGDATLLYDLDTPAASDLITVASGAFLDIGTGVFDLSNFTFTAGGNFAPGVYPLITTGAPINGSLGPVLTGTLGGQDIVLGLSADGHSLELTVGVVTSPLVTWRQAKLGTAENAGDAADSADPDADGIPNLIEYALGGEPMIANASIAPTVATVPGKLTLTFSRIADPALTYAVQASDTFAADSWTGVWLSTGADNVAGTVTATDTETLASHPRRFLRLKVSY